VKQAVSALGRAWEAVLSKGIPPQMASQMKADIEALNGATNDGAAQAAALRIAQNELDLRLLYQRVINVDLAKLALWARQLPVDIAADHAGFVLADVAALDRVWERTRHGVQAPEVVDGAMQKLRQATDAGDLSAVDRAATALTRAVDGLRAR
jgi:hypothetical protein